MTRPCSPQAHQKSKARTAMARAELESYLVVVVTAVVFDIGVCL